MCKQGYLWKQCSPFNQIKKKWVILDSETLYCYKQNKQDLTHTFDINKIKDIKTSKCKSLQFQVTYTANTNSKQVTFIAASAHDMQHWVTLIKNAITIQPQNASSSTDSKFQEFRYKKRGSISPILRDMQHIKKKLSHFQNLCSTQTARLKKLKTELHFKDHKIEILTRQIRRLKLKLCKYRNNDSIHMQSISDEFEYDNMVQKQIDIESVEQKRKSSYLSVSENNSYHNHKITSCNSYSKMSIDTSLPVSPQLSLHASTTSIVSPMSDNEFEIDGITFNSTSHFDYNVNGYDIFDSFKDIKACKLNKKLIHETIIFESLIKVYSCKREKYIDVALILTKTNMYFVSALNYKIWEEFRDRTQINDVMSNDNTKIDKIIANKLVNNLDLIDDNSKLMRYFIGKSKNEIKFEILFNTNNTMSLSSLFDDILQYNYNEQFKDVKHIIIEDFFNENIIPKNQIDKFLEYILDGISWIDQQKKDDCIIITLQKYHKQSIIKQINNKKLSYFNMNKILHSEKQRIKINTYDENNKIKYSYNTHLKYIGLKQYIDVELLDYSDKFKYGMTIKHCMDINNDILCLFDKNNIRNEWITHLDYTLNYDKFMHNYNENNIENNNESKTEWTKDKLMNDFSNNEGHFGFGEYLNYWENGFDNSVYTRYKTLKEELLNNKIAPISKKDYYWLYEKCLQIIKTKRYKIKAKNIGVNNTKFNIKKGETITINHLIALKLYTDYAKIQRKFKKHCRKYNEYESLQDFIERNSEIAIWCRLLKESGTFFGTLCTKNTILYTGLKEKLLFNSMRQHFECPISTTKCWDKARGFCNDNGLILKLKAANTKTRYFDVSWLSHFEHEQERLVTGASLKIIDIYINGCSSKDYINALSLFERICDGKFIDKITNKIEEKLYELMVNYLNIKEYNDINIPPKYIQDLFENMVNKMKKQYDMNNFFINRDELNKLKHQNIFHQFFKHFSIQLTEKNWIQQFEWRIDDDDYKEFINMKARKYYKSNECRYKINKFEGNQEIKFHLETCRKYSDETAKVALFFYIDYLPENIDAIRIEYDLICDKQIKYYNSMMPQWLSKEKRYCGFKTFSSKCLNKNKFICWNIGIKVIDIRYKGSNTQSKTN